MGILDNMLHSVRPVSAFLVYKKRGAKSMRVTIRKLVPWWFPRRRNPDLAHRLLFLLSVLPRKLEGKDE